ncbi:MAG: hypothetical protein LC808_42350, partial [Actinobacteria bacterium]|nr:hypothetical protein [Actinomycetota bacterium]
MWCRANGTWYLRGQAEVVLGSTGDVPVPGRYDHGARTDVAVFRPEASATWNVGASTSAAFG